MLWLHGQLTPLPTMRDLVLPSLVSLLVPVAMLQLSAPEFKSPTVANQPSVEKPTGQLLGGTDLSLSVTGVTGVTGGDGHTGDAGGKGELLAFEEASKRGPLVLAVGLGALLSVPAFKYLTGGSNATAW